MSFFRKLFSKIVPDKEKYSPSNQMATRLEAFFSDFPQFAKHHPEEKNLKFIKGGVYRSEHEFKSIMEEELKGELHLFHTFFIQFPLEDAKFESTVTGADIPRREDWREIYFAIDLMGKIMPQGDESIANYEVLKEQYPSLHNALQDMMDEIRKEIFQTPKIQIKK